jgi:hypothetical protein
VKRPFLVAALLFGFVWVLQAQNQRPISANDAHPPNVVAQKDPSTNRSYAAEAFRGDAQVQSDIILSLEDHHLAGVTVKVTDTEIDLSGKLPDKADKHLAHDIAAAYADGRKVNDHTKK